MKRLELLYLQNTHLLLILFSMRSLKCLLVLLIVLLEVYLSHKPTLPSSRKPRLLYSNQERKDLKRTLLSSIKQAQDSIDIAVYSMTDKAIIKELNKKALHGLPISIWIDKKQVRSLKRKLDPSINLISRPQSGLMHQKIFILDKQVFIGSTNLTTTSLRMHDNLMIGFYNPSWIKPLKEYILTGIKLQEKLSTPSFECYFLPNQSALDRIIELINSSQKCIDIALFTFTHPQITEALIHAQKRGVKIKVVLDYLSTKGASRKVTQTLNDEAIPLFTNSGLQLMHHKMAFIDQKTLIFGSTNWTKSAFKKNKDDLIILSNLSKKEVREVKRVFRHLFWEGKVQ